MTCHPLYVHCAHPSGQATLFGIRVPIGEKSNGFGHTIACDDPPRELMTAQCAPEGTMTPLVLKVLQIREKNAD